MLRHFPLLLVNFRAYLRGGWLVALMSEALYIISLVLGPHLVKGLLQMYLYLLLLIPMSCFGTNLLGILVLSIWKLCILIFLSIKIFTLFIVNIAFMPSNQEHIILFNRIRHPNPFILFIVISGVLHVRPLFLVLDGLLLLLMIIQGSVGSTSSKTSLRPVPYLKIPQTCLQSSIQILQTDKWPRIFNHWTKPIPY